MVILDNADDTSFLLDPPKNNSSRRALLEYLPVCDLGSILITTRNKLAASKLVDHSSVVKIDPMDQKDAVTLLQTKLKLDSRESLNETDLIELVAELEYMPLAVAQAAAYIRERARGRLFNSISRDFKRVTCRS